FFESRRRHTSLVSDWSSDVCSSDLTALWQRLGDVMPFFERHLVLAHSPFEATPPQAPGGRGSYDVPRHLPLAMAPIWRGQLAQKIGRASCRERGESWVGDVSVQKKQ